MQAFYMRWRRDMPREGRVLPPLDSEHPAYGLPCPACQFALGGGKPVQLLAIGPDSETSLATCEENGWFSALAILAHAECLGTDLRGYVSGK